MNTYIPKYLPPLERISVKDLEHSFAESADVLGTYYGQLFSTKVPN